MKNSYRAVQVQAIAPSIEEGIKNLTIQDVERKPLKASEVRVAIRAAAINYFDLLMLVGKYQSKPTLPFTPGAEGAGDIIEIGPNVKNFKVGDKVMIAMSGSMLAEETVVSELMLIPMPSLLSYQEASGFGVGYCTAYHGLVHRGQLTKGDILMVTGAAGGMGIAAIQVGKALGAQVIACASSKEKLEACLKVGADHVINYTTQDLKSETERITKGKMCNVIYESVGGEAANQALRCVAGQGRFLVIGFASGTIPTIPANIPLIKGFSVVGVRSGAEMRLNPKLTKDMIKELLSLANAGKLTPLVYANFPIDKVTEAMSVVANRSVIGKAVVSTTTQHKL